MNRVDIEEQYEMRRLKKKAEGDVTYVVSPLRKKNAERRNRFELIKEAKELGCEVGDLI